MVHRWKCHVIRNGRRDSPEHTYGSFEFPSLGPVLDGDVLQGSVSGSSGWDWVRRAAAVAVAECFLSGAGLVSRYDRVEVGWEKWTPKSDKLERLRCQDE